MKSGSARNGRSHAVGMGDASPSRIFAEIVLAATLFAAGWHFYKWFDAQQERCARSSPLPENNMRPANRPVP
jgi:hypothetical protein